MSWYCVPEGDICLEGLPPGPQPLPPGELSSRSIRVHEATSPLSQAVHFSSIRKGEEEGTGVDEQNSAGLRKHPLEQA